MRGRFKESLQVGEKDVAAAAQEGGEASQTEAFEYKLQPIVLIVPRGSAPAAVDLRRKEAESLRERVQTCEQANSLLQVDAECRDPRRRHQDFGRHPGPLRELLDKTPIGHLTPPEITKQGVEMVALCETEADQDRHAEEAGNPGKDVRPEIRGEVESLPERNPQSRDDRMSLIAWQSPSR